MTTRRCWKTNHIFFGNTGKDLFVGAPPEGVQALSVKSCSGWQLSIEWQWAGALGHEQGTWRCGLVVTAAVHHHVRYICHTKPTGSLFARLTDGSAVRSQNIENRCEVRRLNFDFCHPLAFVLLKQSTAWRQHFCNLVKYRKNLVGADLNTVFIYRLYLPDERRRFNARNFFLFNL